MIMIAMKTTALSRESVQRTQRLLFVAFERGSVAAFRERQVAYFPTPSDEVGMTQGAENAVQE